MGYPKQNGRVLDVASGGRNGEKQILSVYICITPCMKYLCVPDYNANLGEVIERSGGLSKDWEAESGLNMLDMLRKERLSTICKLTRHPVENQYFSKRDAK